MELLYNFIGYNTLTHSNPFWEFVEENTFGFGGWEDRPICLYDSHEYCSQLRPLRCPCSSLFRSGRQPASPSPPLPPSGPPPAPRAFPTISGFGKSIIYFLPFRAKNIRSQTSNLPSYHHTFSLHLWCFSGVKSTISRWTAWNLSNLGGMGHIWYRTLSPLRGMNSPSMSDMWTKTGWDGSVELPCGMIDGGDTCV